MRAELLPPLPPGRPSCRAGGYFHEPRRVSLHCKRRGKGMTAKKDGDEPKFRTTTTNGGSLNRRSILFGSTSIAAASALITSGPAKLAQAQTQPAPSGR